MKGGDRSRAGFSLVEVSLTLGIVVFALVGLIGVLPLALEQSRTCVNETRGAQLARMVCSTLEGESYTAAKCFAPVGTEPLNLSTMTATSAPVVLYASYGVRDEVSMVRTAAAPLDAEYRIELRFQPAPVTASTPNPVRGQAVNLKITAYPAQKAVAFEGVEFLSRLQRSIRPK
jgi:hypothetical protein